MQDNLQNLIQGMLDLEMFCSNSFVCFLLYICNIPCLAQGKFHCLKTLETE
jgi:hypothetical protein